MNVPLNLLRASDGLFTKTGKLFNYQEWHSFGMGVLAGIGRKTEETSWERDCMRVSHPLEWQYYHWGYVGANRIKWSSPPTLAVMYGTPYLKELVAACL